MKPIPTLPAGASSVNALRNVPLKRRRKRKRAGNYFLRLLLPVLGGVVAAYALFQICVKLTHPYRLGYEMSQEVRQAQSELDKQRIVNSELYRRIRYIKTPEGIEREARRQGFYRPKDRETIFLLKEVTPETPENPEKP
jgi:hypothetical protein